MDQRRLSLTPLALAAVSVVTASGFARVYTGRWLVPVLLAATIPHALGWVSRRRHWPAVVEAVIPSAALLVFLVWTVAPGTTIAGIPTLESLERLGSLLAEGGRVMRTESAPVSGTGGPLLLGTATIWLAAQVSDSLAFRARTTLGAVVPQLVVFVVVATIGEGGGQVLYSLAFAAAVSAFFLLAQLDRLEARRAWSSGSRAVALRRMLGAGALLGAVGLAAGGTIGPRLPGADAEPILDTSTSSDEGGGTIQARTLDIGGYLRTEPPRDLFTVDTGAGVARNWRLTALDVLSRGGWTLSETDTRPAAGALDSPGSDTAVLEQQVVVDGLESNFLPAAFQPTRFQPLTRDLDDARFVDASGSLLGETDAVTGGYLVTSAVPALDAEDRARLAERPSGPIPADLERYLDVPDALPPIITDAAGAAVGEARTPFEKAAAIESYFDESNGWVYDLDVDYEGASDDTVGAIAQFLAAKRGYCVPYASAYVLLARLNGLPARLAIGFTSGTRDAQGRYRVTTENAHSWPEVWFAGAGWLPLEPTPGSAPDQPFFNQDDPTNTPDQQPAPPTTAAPAPPTTAPRVPTSAPAAPTTLAAPAPAAPARGGLPAWVTASLLVLAVALALVAGALGAVVGVKARRRSRRRRAADPRRAVTGAWDEALDRLAEAGVRPPRAFTPVEFAEDLARLGRPRAVPPARELAALATEARWSPHPIASDEAARAWDAVGRLDAAIADGTTRRVRWRRRLDLGTVRTSPRRRSRPAPATRRRSRSGARPSDA